MEMYITRVQRMILQSAVAVTVGVSSSKLTDKYAVHTCLVKWKLEKAGTNTKTHHTTTHRTKSILLQM